MVTNGGFLVTKIKQLGDRIFEKVLAEKGVDAFNSSGSRTACRSKQSLKHAVLPSHP